MINDQPVATGRFRKKHCFIKFERIATLKAFRGMKIASLLMQKMQEEALKQYPKYLQMASAQTSAIGFYIKLGWISIGKEYMEANILHQTILNPPKDIEQIKKLKCIEDPNCPEDIKLSPSKTSAKRCLKNSAAKGLSRTLSTISSKWNQFPWGALNKINLFLADP